MNLWSDEVIEGKLLLLLTPDEFAQLPEGTVVYSIGGQRQRAGVDECDLETRFGHSAWGLHIEIESDERV